MNADLPVQLFQKTSDVVNPHEILTQTLGLYSARQRAKTAAARDCEYSILMLGASGPAGFLVYGQSTVIPQSTLTHDWKRAIDSQWRTSHSQYMRKLKFSSHDLPNGGQLNIDMQVKSEN